MRYYTRLTPPGEGGIGKLLVWGDDALGLVGPLFRGRRPLSGPGLYHGQLVRGAQPLDEVLLEVTVDDPPQVAVSAHGGALSLRRITDCLAGEGATAASQRSFLRWASAGRGGPDRARAEGRLAVQLARTDRALEIALRQQAGRFSDALARVAVAEDPAVVVAGLCAALPLGKALFAPTRLAIVGPSNVGKSRLFNRLAGDTLALVDSEPGTTRDGVSCWIALDGVPLELFDTRAGETPVGARLIVVRAPGHGEQVRVPTDGVLVWNKSDLEVPPASLSGALPVSAETGAGLDSLRARLLAPLRDALDDGGARPVPVCESQWALCEALAELVASGADRPMLTDRIGVYQGWDR